MRTGLSGLQKHDIWRGIAQEHLWRANQSKDEIAAHAFMLAWLLPSAVFREISDLRVIAIRSQLPISLVEQRAAEVDREFDLTEPPDWSAARTFTLHYTAAPEEALHVVLRDGGILAVRVPVGEFDRKSRERQMRADLVACTPQEFARRYRKYAVTTPGFDVDLDDPIAIDLPDLRKWAVETRLSRCAAIAQVTA